MIIDIVQRKKDLYAASFTIYENSKVAGVLQLQGRFGSNEGVWNGQFQGRSIFMKRTGSGRIGDDTVFRPYAVHLADRENGTAYQTVYKKNFFNRIRFERLILGNQTYELYTVGMGDKGIKCPVYSGERQIALIEKESVIQNDLYRYHIIALDERAADIAVIFCCYVYVNSNYKAGSKVTASTQRNYIRTTNKFLLSKYDENFERIYRD